MCQARQRTCTVGKGQCQIWSERVLRFQASAISEPAGLCVLAFDFLMFHRDIPSIR